MVEASLLSEHDKVARTHALGKPDAEHAGEVIVAGARMPHLVVEP